MRKVLIPLVEAKARYLQPSSYGDEIVAESRVLSWKRSSFVIHHRLLREGALAVEGWETRVWATTHPTESGRLKSVPLPSDVIEALSAPGADQRQDAPDSPTQLP